MATSTPALPVFDIEKNRGESIRVQIREYEGKRYVDVRTHFWDESGDVEELKPTRKGISLGIDKLPELKRAVDALFEAAELERRGAA